VPASHRSKGLYVVLLLVVSAVLDFFSIASFLPLVFFIIDPAFMSGNEAAATFSRLLGFESAKANIIFLTAIVLIIIVVKNVLSFWIAGKKIRYAFEVGNHLSSNALQHYMRITFLEFSQVDYTRELNRITNYPFSFANNILIPISMLISETLICFMFIIGMAYFDFKMLLLLFAILTPALLLYQTRRKSLEKINQALKEKYPALLKSALQVVEGHSEIKVFRKESFFQKNFQGINKSLTEVFIKDQALQAGTLRFTELVVALVICALIVYTVVAYQNYQQTLALLSVYCAASFRMIPSANRILHALQQIKMHEYLLDELSLQTVSPLSQAERASATPQFNDSIALSNVSFQYPNGATTLRDVSLLVRKGEKIGIIGNSGEGKTSLLLILLRFLEPTSGKIVVDKKDDLSEADWRSLIGYVPQHPYIVDGTICENIAFGIPPAEIDRTKVLQLIEALDLGKLLDHLPDGIDTRIGERGAKLSGGQKQRLAIGRALYADPPILLLDEVTNQVHLSVELEIINLLDRLADGKKTVIMVTHKLPRKNFFDSIYRLEKGTLYPELVPSQRER
jgi:ABC-type multidrug transport system fused ATPase/permease subunit